MKLNLLVVLFLLLLVPSAFAIIDATDFHTIYGNSTATFNRVKVTGGANAGANISIANTTDGIIITQGDDPTKTNCWYTDGIGTIGSVWFNVTPPANHTGFNISYTYVFDRATTNYDANGPYFGNRSFGIPADANVQAVPNLSGYFATALDQNSRMRLWRYIDGTRTYSGTTDSWNSREADLVLNVTLDGTTWFVQSYRNGTRSYTDFNGNLSVADSGWLNKTMDMGIALGGDASGCPAGLWNFTVKNFKVMWKGGTESPPAGPITNYSVSWFSNSTNVTSYNYSEFGSFSINWTAGNATAKNVSYSIFSSNNSGTWTNATEQAGNAYSVVFTDILTLNQSQANYTVGYKWFGNSSDNLWNVTDEFILTKTNTTTAPPIINWTPVWSNNLSNASQYPGSVATYSVVWAMPNLTAGTNLSYVIFSTNNSGDWVNLTPTSVGNKSYNATNTITLNSSSFLNTIGYKWFANSTDMKWNVTDTFETALVGYIPIYTCNDLQNIANLTSVYRRYYIMNDIDCTNITNFDPIFNFSGEINGQNHTISHITQAQTNNEVGMIGTVNTPSGNLTYLHSFIIKDSSFTGTVATTSGAALVAVKNSDGTLIIQEVALKDVSLSCQGDNNCGPFVAYANAGTYLYDVYNTGSVSVYAGTPDSVIAGAMVGAICNGACYMRNSYSAIRQIYTLNSAFPYFSFIAGVGSIGKVNVFSLTKSYYPLSGDLGGGSGGPGNGVGSYYDQVLNCMYDPYSLIGGLPQLTIYCPQWSSDPTFGNSINSVINETQYGYWVNKSKYNTPPMNLWNTTVYNASVFPAVWGKNWNLTRVGTPTYVWENYTPNNVIWYGPKITGLAENVSTGYIGGKMPKTTLYSVYDGIVKLNTTFLPWESFTVTGSVTWLGDNNISCVICQWELNNNFSALLNPGIGFNQTPQCGFNSDTVRANCTLTNSTPGKWTWKQYANDTDNNWNSTAELDSSHPYTYFGFIMEYEQVKPILVSVQNPVPAIGQTAVIINTTWQFNSTYSITPGYWTTKIYYPNGTVANTTSSVWSCNLYLCNTTFALSGLDYGTYTWKQYANGTIGEEGVSGNYSFYLDNGVGMTGTTTVNASYIYEGGALLTTTVVNSSTYNLTHYWLAEQFPNGTIMNYSVYNFTDLACAKNWSSCTISSVGLPSPKGIHYVWHYFNNSNNQEGQSNHVYFYVASEGFESMNTTYLGSADFWTSYGIWMNLTNWTTPGLKTTYDEPHQPAYAYDLNWDTGDEYIYIDGTSILLYENKTLDLKGNYTIPSGWNSHLQFVRNYSNGTIAIAPFKTGIVWLTVEGGLTAASPTVWFNEIFWNSNADKAYRATDITATMASYANGTQMQVACGAEKCVVVYGDYAFQKTDGGSTYYTSPGLRGLVYNSKNLTWGAEQTLSAPANRTRCFPRYSNIEQVDYDQDGETELIFNYVLLAGAAPNERVTIYIMNISMGNILKKERLINATIGNFVSSSVDTGGGVYEVYCDDTPGATSAGGNGVNGATNLLIYDADNNPSNNYDIVMGVKMNDYNTKGDFEVWMINSPYTAWHKFDTGHGLSVPYYYYGNMSNLVRASVFSPGDHDFCAFGYDGQTKPAVGIPTYDYPMMALCGSHWNSTYQERAVLTPTFTTVGYVPESSYDRYNDVVYTGQYGQQNNITTGWSWLNATYIQQNTSEFVTPYGVWSMDLSPCPILYSCNSMFYMNFEWTPTITGLDTRTSGFAHIANDSIITPAWDRATYDFLMVNNGTLRYLDDGAVDNPPYFINFSINPCLTVSGGRVTWKLGTNVSLTVTASDNNTGGLPNTWWRGRVIWYDGEASEYTTAWSNWTWSNASALFYNPSVGTATANSTMKIQMEDNIFQITNYSDWFNVSIDGDYNWSDFCVSSPVSPPGNGTFNVSTNTTITNDTLVDSFASLASISNVDTTIFWLILLAVIITTLWIIIPDIVLKIGVIAVVYLAWSFLGYAFKFINIGILILLLLVFGGAIFVIIKMQFGRSK